MGDEDPGQRGRELRGRLFGESWIDVPRSTDAVAPVYGEIADNLVFGNIWLRDGLPLEIRSMVTIAALLARGLFDYTRIQMYGAKRLGVTRDQIAELCIQLIPYVGMPVAQSGLGVLGEVFADDASDEAPSW